jgi:D-aminoacyl-tRNA deacylase
MRAIIQRVSEASVSIGEKEVGRCARGLLLLVGVHKDDLEANAEKLASKVVNLRIFNDEQRKMNLSVIDVGGQILAVSNFTVFGDATKNRRPSFIDSAPFDRGRELFDLFVRFLQEKPAAVETGVFGADMQVSLVNDGPVTVIVDA